MNARGASMLAAVLLAGPVAAEMLSNGDFEAYVVDEERQRAYPESWKLFSALNEENHITMTRAVFRSERQAVRLRAQQQPQAYQGLFQELDVEGGQAYEFTVHVYIHEFDRVKPPVHMYLAVEWYDGEGNKLQRETGEKWGHTIDPDEWRPYRLSVRAPKESVTAVFSIVQEDGRIGTGSGSFFIDDASITAQ